MNDEAEYEALRDETVPDLVNIIIAARALLREVMDDINDDVVVKRIAAFLGDAT